MSIYMSKYFLLFLSVKLYEDIDGIHYTNIFVYLCTFL